VGSVSVRHLKKATAHLKVQVISSIDKINTGAPMTLPTGRLYLLFCRRANQQPLMTPESVIECPMERPQ
jgi:hypothetical protein